MNRSLFPIVPWARLALCASALLAPASARGVIIDTLDGTGNTTAPSDDPGWANVGTVGNGSAVYLGNRWAITATHVWTGPTTFNGTTYQNVPGSEITLSNNGAAGQTAYTDLVLYQLATDPGLPTLSIASSRPANNAGVTMIGAGKDRGSYTQWSVDVATNPYTWTVNGSGGTPESGYEWGSGNTMRWGTNSIYNAGWVTYNTDEAKSAYMLQTTFSAYPYYSSECQAAAGDSGGALFYKSGSGWELAGLMLVTAEYSGQPVNTAVFGDLTYSADLSYYRSQIVQVVPEPGAAVLAALGGLTLAVAGRLPRRRS